MLELELFDSDGSRRLLEVPDESIIGKGARNEIRLDSWRIAREHARLFSTRGGVLIEDLGGFGGVLVNGSRIDGQHGPLTGADMIAIGPYRMRVLDQAAAPGEEAAASSRPPAAPPAAVAGPSAAPKPASVPAQPHAPPLPSAPAADPAARHLEFEWRKTIHARLLETMDLRRQDVHGMSDQQLRHETETLVRQIMRDADAEIPRARPRAADGPGYQRGYRPRSAGRAAGG